MEMQELCSIDRKIPGIKLKFPETFFSNNCPE